MAIRKIGITLGIVGAAVLFSVVIAGKAANNTDNQHLSGSWLLVVNLSSPPPGVTIQSYKTLMTFTTDGAVLETSWQPGTGNVGHGHGGWERIKNGEFAVTAIALWTNQGQPVSVLKGRSAIKLDKTGDTFTGSFRADVLDVNGNPVAQGAGTLQGTRIEVETP